MGFSVLIDIMGSMIIGGIILLMIGDVNSSIVENNYDRNQDLQSHFNLTITSRIIEDELRNIGYSADYLSDPRKDSLILLAGTDKIKFLFDYDMNKVLDTIYYYVGSKEEMKSTSNPNDHYLYKRVNSKVPERIASGIVVFGFEYYNENGTKLIAPINLNDIRSFQLSLTVASGEKRLDKNLKDPYPQEYWRQTTVTARNLTKR